ncbi:MAG: glycosyltransferase [Rikenellaceae bacterium]|jgi:glycosyltransferase involved in cell wall biosynthesis|nr:glycosyltransferase [Rikenellaceae bacterium]
MKRALHLLDRLRFGGAESLALNYARLMKGWGVASTLCGRADSPAFEAAACREAEVRRGFSYRAIRRADVLFIHSNRNLLRLFLLRPFLRLSGKQVVYIQHLPYSEGKFRLLAQVINRLCTGFIRITPLTEALEGRYIRVPVAFVPNFYRPRYEATERPEVRRSVREACGLTQERELILFSGALKQGKGLVDFLALADRFADDPRRLFVVVGDGPERGLIGEKERKNLLWTGWQADVEQWLIAADRYCFLSEREMMPLALIEALTLGVPTAAIASPVNDFLTGGKTFASLSLIEQAIRAGQVPLCPPPPSAEEAEKVLQSLLSPQRKKKILHIQVQSQMAGAQRISLEIFRRLPEAEYEKTILFGAPQTSHTPYCTEQFRRAGAQVLFLPDLRREIGWRDFGAFWAILRLCRRERFDIVHTHSTKPGVVGRVAARLAGVPRVVHTVHGVAFHPYETRGKQRLYRAIEWCCSPFAHRIVLVSAYYRQYYRTENPKTCVIPNGISVEPVAEPFSADDGTIRLLFVGRLTEAKDPLTLLRAMALLVGPHERQEFRLTVVGDGELEGLCRDFVEHNGLSEYVSFAGWQSDTSALYSKYQIFCLSSIFEAFGLVLAEAARAGLPVVATRVGGIPEVVEEGVTGFLVPPRDPVALAERILALADDPALARRMGQQGRARVEALFTAERMVERYKQVYNEKAFPNRIGWKKP